MFTKLCTCMVTRDDVMSLGNTPFFFCLFFLPINMCFQCMVAVYANRLDIDLPIEEALDLSNLNAILVSAMVHLP